MAFIRRKGNSIDLVHNVRRGGKVKQLHLARLNGRARITEDVVRKVSKKHPFVEVNWRSLREKLSHEVSLGNPRSASVQKLIAKLRALHVDLADLRPPVLRISKSPAVARKLLVQLRLLQTTLELKLSQLEPVRQRFGNASSQGRRR